MTTPTLTTNQIVSKILNKIKSAQTILVVCSKPIDPDSLGTALAFKIWLEQIDKDVTVINSFRLSEDMKNFPNVDQINFNQENPNLNKYDLVITLDSSIWSHLFINKEIVSKQNLDKFVNIDHHFPADIAEDIPDTTLREPSSSTAEVFYTYFLTDNSKITSQMATHLYLALVGDTGNFKWAIGANTMKFANALINAGADLQLAEFFFKPTDKALNIQNGHVQTLNTILN
jgi:bifunctional oligoribonuclease and PAP phosphatase NrnA